MEQFTSILSAIIGSIVALIASVLASWVSRVRRRNLEKLRSLAEYQFRNSMVHELERRGTEAEKTDINHLKELLNLSASTIATSSSPIGTVSQKYVETKIDEKITSLKQRLEEIERRFPSSDTVDKIASVNDAILATQLESLSQTVANLENRILSRWDIAKVVFQVLAALSALLGVALAIMNYVV